MSKKQRILYGILILSCALVVLTMLFPWATYEGKSSLGGYGSFSSGAMGLNGFVVVCSSFLGYLMLAGFGAVISAGVTPQLMPYKRHIWLLAPCLALLTWVVAVAGINNIADSVGTSYGSVSVHVECKLTFWAYAALICIVAMTAAGATAFFTIKPGDDPLTAEQMDAPAGGEKVPAPEKLESWLQEKVLLDQFRKTFGKEALYRPRKYKNYWRCTCGLLNASDVRTCGHCNRSCDSLLKMDEHALRKQYAEETAEREQAEQARVQQAAHSKKVLKKAAMIGIPAIAVAIVVVLLILFVFVPSGIYSQAEKYLEEGNLEMAAITFGRAGGWSDARERSRELWNQFVSLDVLSVDTLVAAIREDGSLYLGDQYSGIRRIENGEIIPPLGSYTHSSEWHDLVDVAVGSGFVAGLRSDGTVVTALDTKRTIELTTDWQDIVCIEAGNDILLGLRSDGTILVAGKLNDEEAVVTTWENVVAIKVDAYDVAALTADGELLQTEVPHGGENNAVALLENRFETDYGTYDGKRIVKEYTCGNITYSLLEDGTLCADGFDSKDISDTVEEWTNIRIPPLS